MANKTFYITTTLPYVNADLHMGHALEFVRADAIARYKKLMGYDVFFNTGTDEHGIKMLRVAEKEGMNPQAFVDASFLKFKNSLSKFGMMGEEDGLHFIRTTDEKHIKGAQAFWKKCADNGYIYQDVYEAKYCVGCESEKTDSDLVEGFCPDHPGIPLEVIKEKNYFFKYSAFGEKLGEFYKNNPNFVIPDFRFNEVKAFVERGLQDFSISRLKTKMPWGIPVPGDDEHVMYVWFDALTNYINTLGYPYLDGDFEKYWVHGTPTQYCGKDNTRFQASMWQAMLMAAEVPNSHQIVVNGFVMGDGGVKMSKTLGNVVDPKEISDEYGIDALRYFLLREIAPFEDSPFSKERFKEAYNANLANGLGNLVSRVLTMAENYNVSMIDSGEFSRLEIENFNIQEYTNKIWNKIQSTDKKIQEKEPYKLFKTEPEFAKEIVVDLLSDLYHIAKWLQPIMPETSKKILELLKNSKKPEAPLFLRKD